ncbi:hypothetical protein [Mesorhizobium sp. SP-1A]|uniref:type IV toxin-antitoxin system AbiEi family antitoxin domain-containing protein n=1 Tax=Mesorhizobium sp. SP-1A TaxID=3077840 RepID=UPI0028F6F65A|nr:hypothetical protein [Mesorhizobium sp. SP-1A]
MKPLEDVFAEKKIYRTSDLSKMGFRRDDIQQALAEGFLIRPILIEKEGPVIGIVAASDVQYAPEFDDCVIMEATGGIIAFQSAAMRHFISTSIRNSVDVILPYTILGNNNAISPTLNVAPHRSLHRASFEVGVEDRPTELGVNIRITSPARTIVDLLRNEKHSADDYRHGVYALNSYIENGENLEELTDIAAAFHFDCSQEIEQAQQRLENTTSRGMGL